MSGVTLLRVTSGVTWTQPYIYIYIEREREREREREIQVTHFLNYWFPLDLMVKNTLVPCQI